MLTLHRPSAKGAVALLCAALVVGAWSCRTATGPCPALTLTVTPASLTMLTNSAGLFTATSRDYRGNVVSTSATWSVVAGGGTINATSGLFSSGATTGPYPNTVKATRDGLTGYASVTVVDTLPGTPSATLGLAGPFSILAGSTVTNTGVTTTIEGDVGVSPGLAITGIPAGQPSPGSTYSGVGSNAGPAQTDLTAAYNDLAGRACGANLTSLDLGGMTLPPGVYCFDTSAGLTGTLTLDGQGDPNAVFVFQVGSTLTTASTSAVTLIGGAQAANVYWQVGSSATLGTGTAFQGTIAAQASVTLNNGASLNGRALARTGAVTLDTNAVTMP